MTTISRIDPPAAIVAPSAQAVKRLLADPADVPAVAARRVYAPPAIPFAWGPRPPSVNRVLGMIWMAYVLPGRTFDAAFFADLRAFCNAFYHVDPSDEQLLTLLRAD
jgi:iron complex transport system substrate-binding protein